MTYLELQVWRGRVHDLYHEALRAKQIANDEDRRLREYVQGEWSKALLNSKQPRATEEE